MLARHLPPRLCGCLLMGEGMGTQCGVPRSPCAHDPLLREVRALGAGASAAGRPAACEPGLPAGPAPLCTRTAGALAAAPSCLSTGSPHGPLPNPVLLTPPRPPAPHPPGLHHPTQPPCAPTSASHPHLTGHLSQEAHRERGPSAHRAAQPKREAGGRGWGSGGSQGNGSICLLTWQRQSKFVKVAERGSLVEPTWRSSRPGAPGSRAAACEGPAAAWGPVWGQGGAPGAHAIPIGDPGTRSTCGEEQETPAPAGGPCHGHQALAETAGHHPPLLTGKESRNPHFTARKLEPGGQGVRGKWIRTTLPNVNRPASGP